MRKARLMSAPEDYSKLGIKKGIVEPWEDGRRDNSRSGAFEWWYFDTMLDDGTKIVITYAPKPSELAFKDEDHPFVHINVTFSDGTGHQERFSFSAEEAQFSKEGCDIKIGPHTLKGNLKEYFIKIVTTNGYGVDLKLKSLGTPWRPETGYFSFGDQEEQYFTWLCVVPKGEITGTVTLGGEEKEVKGFGYHDHQWGNIIHYQSWNHWIWIRQNMGDYNLLIFDLWANKNFGYKHYPVAFIEDKDGNVIFENFEDVKFEVVEEYLQEKTGKYYPKHVKYNFENGGKTVEYSLKVKNEIEIIDIYGSLDEAGKGRFDQLEIQPTYTRYEGIGEMKINEGSKTIERSGELLYEMVYCGKSYRNLI